MKTQGVQTLHFYAVGPEFTTLIRNLIYEGNFYTALSILKDGGAPKEMIEEFFKFEAEFVGDTREDTFSIQSCEKQGDDLDLVYYVALRTLTGDEPNFEQINLLLIDENKTKEEERIAKNYNALLEVFSESYLKDLIFERVITRYYGIGLPNDTYNDGVILQDGTFVVCGYQEHRLLYPALYDLGKVEASDWLDEKTAFHISSGELSGALSHAIEDPEYSDCLPTEAQLDELFNRRESLSFYGFGRGAIAEGLRTFINKTVQKGGKFNNLTFLNRFYSDQINLPKFSLEQLDIPLHFQCIRTSPRYSLPGLLNSKFNLNNVDEAIKEIEADFEKYGDVVGDPNSTYYKNELHYFFQEFLIGQNGVAHCRGANGDDRVFTYQASDEQGSVVEGKEASVKIKENHEKELERICRLLNKDLNQSIQVEFISTSTKLYIVQLRVLQAEPESTGSYKPDNILFTGKSFSAEFASDLSIEDVLIIDKDIADSSLLIGKKALIVRNDVEFSHALALSKAIGIPSIFAVGDVDIPKKFTINTKQQEGWILK